jgi:hypothetical protein
MDFIIILIMIGMFVIYGYVGINLIDELAEYFNSRQNEQVYYIVHESDVAVPERNNQYQWNRELLQITSEIAIQPEENIQLIEPEINQSYTKGMRNE